jgi:large subunit ribosomal protein L13
LKERRLKDQMEKDPTEVIRKAVLRMLPRNKLRDVSENVKLHFSFILH